MADAHTPVTMPDESPRPIRRGSDQTGKKADKRLLQAGIAFLLLFLVVFAIYQCARHLTVELNTLRTQEIVDTVYTDLALWVFRDEQPVSASAGNVFCYDVRDGEKVPVGTTLGMAYTVPDAENVPALQKQLNAYGDRIAGLSRIFGNAAPTDAQDAAERAEASYRNVLNAVSDGNIASLSDCADDLLSAMDTWRALTGSGDDRTIDADTLREEQASLVRGLVPGGSFSTDRAGWFYYGTDGYELNFPYEKAADMTPAEFREMTQKSAYAAGYGTAGRMVYTDVWYAAALMTVEEASAFKVGSTCTLLCGDGAGTELKLTVERVESDSYGSMVVFSSQDMPDGFRFDRRIFGQVVVSRTSGYRIPAGALVTQTSPSTNEQVTGVWVLEGNRVQFRRVMVKKTCDGYVIADTSQQVDVWLLTANEQQTAQIKADGWEFLQLNDRMITGGRNLHEGKVIG